MRDDAPCAPSEAVVPRRLARARLQTAATAGAGFTLVELLVAGFVVLVGMLGVVSMMIGANQRSVATRGREGATNVQRELIERSRSIPYHRLTQAAVYTDLQSIPGLEDQSPNPGYQIARRGFTYVVALNVCSVDDPKDNFGAHDQASFCAGSTAGTLDRNPDDYKVVTVDVTWSGSRGSGHSRQQGLINSPGAKVGPSIAAITISPASTSNVVTSDVSPVAVSVTSSFAATTVDMSVDGDSKGSATGSGTSWAWQWPIGSLVDGTYLLGARAFDALGRSGPARSLTVTLNRRLPAAPASLLAGLNGAHVELEWLANPERDVIGYNVYRGGTAVASCAVVEDTACRDLAPTGSLVYTVRALDRGPDGSVREGAASNTASVSQTNLAPNPPTNLVASANSDGDTVLTWTAPSPPSPSPDTDLIAFYRIYRDGQTYQDRWDRTATGSETTWTDARNAGGTHTYWVTAVDPFLSESTALGPVTK